jgi:hypothetical protein
VDHLIAEAERMTAASIRFARGVDYVQTPAHPVPLRTRVRTEHGAALRRLHEAINERFGTTGASDDYVNVFYAASEMALMEQVGRSDLSDDDRRTLRDLWDALLTAT